MQKATTCRWKKPSTSNYVVSVYLPWSHAPISAVHPITPLSSSRVPWGFHSISPCGLMYAYPLLILFSFFAAHQMMDLLGHITSPRGTLLGCCLSQKSHPVYYLPSRSISALTTCPDLQTKNLVYKNITLIYCIQSWYQRKKEITQHFIN